MNIEIRNVNYSDEGSYTLKDRSSRVVSVTRMDLTGWSQSQIYAKWYSARCGAVHDGDRWSGRAKCAVVVDQSHAWLFRANRTCYHSFTLTQACVRLWLQITTNTQGETRFWVFSSCWAFRLESAAAVERRFSSRKPPLLPLYRYADQSSTERRKEQNVRHAFVHTLPGCSVESDKAANLSRLHLHEVNKQGVFYSSLSVDVDGCLVSFTCPCQTSPGTPHTYVPSGPAGPCPPYNTPGQPGAVRSLAVDGVRFNETAVDFNVF